MRSKVLLRWKEKWWNYSYLRVKMFSFITETAVGRLLTCGVHQPQYAPSLFRAVLGCVFVKDPVSHSFPLEVSNFSFVRGCYIKSILNPFTWAPADCILTARRGFELCTRWEPVIYGSSTETEEFSCLICETNPGAISLLPNSDQGTVLSEFQQ